MGRLKGRYVFAALLSAALPALFAGAVSGQKLHVIGVEPVVGVAAPDFSLPAVDGRTVALEEFRGRFVLLSFTSCYADTCGSILTALDNIGETFSSRGLMIPVICSEIPDAMKADDFAGLHDKCGSGHFYLLDGKREVKGRYKVRQLPTTFLLDRDLVILERVRGVTDLYSDEFQGKLDALLP